jgi:capsular polysaccharide biosynthesis protein
MTIPEQVNFFYNASHVAGLLGTAFYNGIFSRQWTKFTAVRVTPSYWYDFEGDIQSVVNVKFDYANVYEHVDTEQVREFLTQTLKSRGRTI